MKSGLGGALGKSGKVKILDGLAHSFQFCESIKNKTLSPAEAVEDFCPLHHFSDNEKAVFIFRDDSFVAQLYSGELLAYDRRNEPAHASKASARAAMDKAFLVG